MVDEQKQELDPLGEKKRGMKKEIERKANSVMQRKRDEREGENTGA